MRFVIGWSCSTLKASLKNGCVDWLSCTCWWDCGELASGKWISFISLALRCSYCAYSYRGDDTIMTYCAAMTIVALFRYST